MHLVQVFNKIQIRNYPSSYGIPFINCKSNKTLAFMGPLHSRKDERCQLCHLHDSHILPCYLTYRINKICQLQSIRFENLSHQTAVLADGYV